MSYSVKEIYYTLQGEGQHAGRPAVFLRFAGCNLWSGREEDRYKAICQFCDTDFWGTDGLNGGKYPTAQHLVAQVNALFPSHSQNKYVVCTGGEPMLQLDTDLVQAFHQEKIEVGIETNGTIPIALDLDWICVSPKEHTVIEQKSGDELKIVYPQGGMDPKDWEHLSFTHFLLSPMDNENHKANIEACVQYCLQNPKWKLSLQTHKMLMIP